MDLICYSFIIFVAYFLQDLMYGSQISSWTSFTKWGQGRDRSTVWNTHQDMRRNLQQGEIENYLQLKILKFKGMKKEMPFLL